MTAQPPPPMAAHAPAQTIKSPKVYGILSIVFASIMLLMSLLGTCGGIAGTSMSGLGLSGGGLSAADIAIFDAMKDELSTLYGASAASSGFFLIMSSLLLAIGIGQVTYRRWAQRWSVRWGAVALVGLVANAVFWMAVVGPLYEELMTTIMDLGQRSAAVAHIKIEGMGTVAGVGGAILSIALLAPYPILLLVNFSRDVVKGAMTR